MIRFITTLLLTLIAGDFAAAQSGLEWLSRGTGAALSDITGRPGGVVISGWTSPEGSIENTTLPHANSSASLLLCMTGAGGTCWARNGAFEHGEIGSTLQAFHVSAAGTGAVYSSEGPPFVPEVGMPAYGGVALNKYGPDGAWQWSVPIGGTGQSQPGDWLAFVRGIGADEDENLYFTGVFRDTLQIGNTVVVGSERETFLGSVDGNGSLRWLRPTGGVPNFEHARYTTDADDPFAVDAEGNTYIGGFYPEDKVFVVEGPNFLQLERDANVIVSFDPEGWFRWIRTDQGEGLDIGAGVTLLRLAPGADGSLVAVWDAGAETIQAGGEQINGGVFITMLDSDGQIQWVRGQHSGDAESISALTVNAAGDILVAGRFNGRTLDLDGTRYTRPGDSDEDGFAALYGRTGGLIWSMHASGPAVTGITSAAFDSSGHVYLTGVFTGELTIGDAVFTGDTGENLFVVKHDPTAPTSTDGYSAAADLAMLSAPYPNPATELAKLSYTLGAPADVSAGLYDVLGRRIATLAQGAGSPGNHELSVDTSLLSSGVYFVHLSAGDRREVRKLVVR